ncbi:HAMP domain-containing sensor histidine kinase [Nocardia sp. NPDC005366]|uniref:sensor histidine kinase n=1 Tax=Nocardia sp. NPDC005366 TaxID=3156878 RepID=UPI0033A91146
MAWQRVRDGLAAVPLRITLVLALVVLAGLGLLISGTLVTSGLEQSLTSRTDQQLREGALEWSRRLRPPAPSAQPPDSHHPPSQFYVKAQSSGDAAQMAVQIDVKAFGVDAEPALPDIPSALPANTRIAVTGPTTVGSVGGSPIQWRTLTLRTQDDVTTVALPLTQNNDTVHRLVVLQLAVGVAVLAVLAVAAYFAIRRSLRPLRRVENIAAAIARGDLHRRVPVRGTNTEVDRLSRSLNGMLAQIQSAFKATEASEAAARRSEAKMRRFVADASHELRTPLTTIRGFAELYRQGATTDPALFMDRIESEAQRMGLLVEDLLMLARLDAQRPLERGQVDLLAVASDAVHNARAVVAAAAPEHPRRIELELRPGEGTLEVSGDAERLRQVLANLLNNALTHTPADADVTVRLTPAEDEVRLEVADTGPGLPEEEAARVFERFYRTDTSRTRASGGTGLGLSIVQALVTAHGGTVTVDSVQGEGTTFTVALPRD